MEKRNIKIDIRVSEKEKEALLRSAKRAGLPLSAYLRKAGLRQKVFCKPSGRLKDCCRVVNDLIDTFRQSTAKSIEQRLNFILQCLLDLYHEREADGGGNDEDLGD